MLAPQTNPARESGFYVSNTKRNSYLLFDSGDVYHCPVLFSRSTDFSSPLQLLQALETRVYVSIVTGGSLTTQIIPIKPS